MKINEVMVRVDFTENDECQMRKAIQAMHFRTSKWQMTLHIGVNRFGQSENSVSFCSLIL